MKDASPPWTSNLYALDLMEFFGVDYQFRYLEKNDHSFPTDFYGDKCSQNLSPYISNCDYSLANATLSFMYGFENPPKYFDSDRFFSFDQGDVYSLDDTGYAYVPKACETKKCPVHMVFHGSDQYFDKIGTKFIEFTGYNLSLIHI